MTEIKSTTGRYIDAGGVNHPAHYNTDKSGVECIEITRHMDFNLGNAFKYIFRAGQKVDAKNGENEDLVEYFRVESEIKDLSKAIWYLKDERKNVKALDPRLYPRHFYEDKIAKVIASREGNIQQAMIMLDQGYFEMAVSAIEAEIKRIKEV